MTLLRRAPREVYRVYSEAEFFDGAAGMELFTPASGSGAGERRLRRLAGAALLAGAVGTMGGAVVLAGSRPTRGSGRRASNGDAHAFARIGLPTRADVQLTRSPVAGGAGVTRTASLTRRAGFGARARAGRPVGRLALAAEVSQRQQNEHRSGAGGTRGELREDARGDATTTITVDAVSGPAPAPAVMPAGGHVSAGVPDREPVSAIAPDRQPTPVAAPESSPSVTTTSPPPVAPSTERAEFGFER
jgi:hypothetical protein